MNTFEKKYYDFEGFWNNDDFNRNNAERIRETAGLIPVDAQTLLDACCGNGILSNHLIQKKRNARVLAFDRSEVALNFVKSNKMIADISNIPLGDQSIDCVMALEVLEHLPLSVYEKAIMEISRVAKKYLIVSVPDNEPLERNMTQCPVCKSIFNADMHLRRFEKKKLHSLFDDYEFQCLAIKPCGDYLVYAGLKSLRKFFRRKQTSIWRSPCCVICGFENTPKTGNKKPTANSSRVGSFLKQFWPKTKEHAWLIGLYGRKGSQA